MGGSNVYLNCLDCLSACLRRCANEHIGERGLLSGCPIDAGEIVPRFVFPQVFGDYYHFRHHAVEKRALSGHRGMHIKLQREPQVRLVSASHSSLQHTPCWQQKARRQIRLHAEIVFISQASMTSC